MSNLESIRKQLTDDGWREFNNHGSRADVSLCKPYDTPHKCVLNPDKPGIQAIIRLFDWSKYEHHIGPPVSLAVEVSGNTPRCHYTLRAHAKDTVTDTLAEIPRLLTAWEELNDAQ